MAGGGREAKKAAKQARMEAGRGQHPGKQPQVAHQPSKEKKPVALGIDHEQAFQRRPVWRFGDLDPEGPPSWGTLTVGDLREMHEKLGDYEKQTCAEIWGQHDNGCKRYEVESAHDNITSRLSALDREDETAVHTLRVNGPYRVYGVLRENVFYVLWIDREHEMWPSTKKNT